MDRSAPDWGISRGDRSPVRRRWIAGTLITRREVYKFVSDFLAGAGVVHANIGVAIVMGMFNEPRHLGRTWSAGSLWIGALESP